MNGKGEVVGINTIKVESAEGIGFAIPINQIKPIIRKVVETGEFKEPYLGVLGYDRAMTSYISSEIMIDTGVYVYNVEFNSPAAKAGIKEGDIILSVDDLEIDTLCELRSILFSKNIGEKMRINVFREGDVVEIIVEVKER